MTAHSSSYSYCYGESPLSVLLSCSLPSVHAGSGIFSVTMDIATIIIRTNVVAINIIIIITTMITIIIINNKSSS
jgi:hypothetical protein